MKTIHKFPLGLEVGQPIAVEVAHNARILHVDVQHGMPCLWMLTDTALVPGVRYFVLTGTGFNLNSLDTDRHVGTVIIDGFVWHIFEINC